MTRALAAHLVAKDARALMLVWSATLAAIAAEYFAPTLRPMVLPTYVLGAATLGACAIGHEYAHRTLGQLLAQPTRRGQVLLLKLAVLGVMLALVSGAAWIVGLRALTGSDEDRLAALLIPAMLAFTVAPWLSMVTRTAIGGAVLSMALPGFLWTVALFAYVRFYAEWPSLAFALTVMWRGGIALALVAAAMTWVMFLGLEVNDAPVAEVRLPSFGAAAAGSVRRGSPIVRLVVKEAYLQQMAIAILAVYCLAWPMFVALGGRYLEIFYVLSLFTPITLALVAGSVSTAEERQIGMFEAQTLLPIAASTRWMAKVAVTAAMTAAGIGLPYLFMTIAPSSAVNAPHAGMLIERPFVLVVAGVMAAAIYMSSLASSGVRALILTLPAMFGVGWVLNTGQTYVNSRAYSILRSYGPLVVSDAVYRVSRYTPEALVAVFLLMLLRFAFTNQRSDDQDVSRVARQAACVVAFAVLFVVAMTGINWMRPPLISDFGIRISEIRSAIRNPQSEMPSGPS